MVGGGCKRKRPGRSTGEEIETLLAFEVPVQLPLCGSVIGRRRTGKVPPAAQRAEQLSSACLALSKYTITRCSVVTT